MKKEQNSIPLPVTVAILAGGKSSRMGRDKAFVPFNGRFLIQTVIDSVRGLGDELLIIANTPADYAQFNLPIFSDRFPDHGSLGGIQTAVYHADHPHTLVVACDMPWLNRDLLRHLISLRHEADIVVPRWTKYPEPLHAVYNKNCLPAIDKRVASKQLKIIRFYDEMTVRYVDRGEIERFDANGSSFANINTPQQLTKARDRGER